MNLPNNSQDKNFFELYSRLVLAIGSRDTITTGSDTMTNVITEELALQVKQAAAVSMGADLNAADLANIMDLAESIVEANTLCNM